MFKLFLFSDEQDHPQEIEGARLALRLGFEAFHLRKPTWSLAQIHEFLTQFNEDELSRIAVHVEEPHFAEIHKRYPQVRMHLKSHQLHLYSPDKVMSHAIHSLDELSEVSQYPELGLLFLSPIYPSISKQDYQVDWDFPTVSDSLSLTKPEVIALGGVQAHHFQELQAMGFSGAALLGSVWRKSSSSDPSIMNSSPLDRIREAAAQFPPRVLVLSGFDPSGAAGFVADIKALEWCGVQGQGVITSQTVQTETHFKSSGSLPVEAMAQLESLLDSQPYSVVKVGYVPNLDFLQQALKLIKAHNPEAQVIWDPVLKATFDSGQGLEYPRAELESLLQEITLLTPNLEEAKVFESLIPSFPLPSHLSGFPSVLVKGGHILDENHNTPIIEDKLYHQNSVTPMRTSSNPKHRKRGTGCTLASLIAGSMAQGQDLTHACSWAQSQMSQFITSNSTLIGSWPQGVNHGS